MTEAGLLHQFARHVADSPSAPALREGADIVSFAQLDRAADNAAQVLSDRGVTAGATVAIEWPVSIRYVTAMLAVMRLGAAFLPLDPGWPADRRVRLARAAAATLVLTDHGTAWQAAEPGLSGRLLSGGELDAAARAYCAAGVPPALASGATAGRMYLMSTSGSAGEPRLVDVPHAAVAGLFSNIVDVFQRQAGSVWSSLHSAAFGYSQWEIWGALSGGGCLCIVSDGARRDPQRWAAELRDAGVTELSLTPSGLRQWYAAGQPSPGAQLRTVFVSGEALTPVDIASWFATASASRPRLISCYGLTETAGRVALHEVHAEDASRQRPVIGTATADAELRILDPHSLEPVADGTPGELFVSGPLLAGGYVGDPIATARRFVELETGDVSGDGNAARRYLRTGDMVVCAADGLLEYIGRRDGQLKLRGQRMEAAEIEQTLQAHPRIAQAGVAKIGTPGGERLEAWVVPAAPAPGIEFWPSLGEYQIYDDLLYDFMAADETRVAAYRRALQTVAPGRVVLDIGTGKDAVLARIAAQAGAEHVYAVEVLPDAAAKARALVAQLGLNDRITVIEGRMEDVTIPQPVEVCVQGIVGNIGSSDGIAPIWNAARQWFAPGCVALPGVCTTYIAPARLPVELRDRATFGALAAEYTRRVFAAEGREFDVRLCVRNFPADALLAPPVAFERLDFHGPLALADSGDCVFTMADEGWVDGYLLWTRLQLGDHVVDFLDHQQAWLPVWFPLGSEPLHVATGAELHLSWSRETPAGQVFPDYRVHTQAVSGGTALRREYCSRHFETASGSTALHRSLLNSAAASAAFPDPDALRAWVAERLPQAMVPAAVHVTASLPLSANRKLDRAALAELAKSAPAAAAAARHRAAGGNDLSSLEQAIAAVWCDVLGISGIGADTDFFAAGGDSISAVRLTTEVQRLLDATVFLTGLYEASTLRGYCAWLARECPEATAKGLVDNAVATPPASPDTTVTTPLNPAQRNLWFLQQLYPDNPAANEQFMIRMRGVDSDRVVAAWADVARAHQALRLQISNATADEAPQQSAATFSAALHGLNDIRDFSARGDSASAATELQRLAQEEIRRPFDLGAGPLYRPVLVALPDAEFVLLVTAHHIAADGLCVELLREQLFVACRDAALPAPATDFLATVPASPVPAGELEWWRERLKGVTLEPVAATLPRPQSAGPEARLPFEIPAPLADAMRALARAQGASLFTVLLAGWRLWLARSFSRDDFLLGSPVTRRTTRATADVIGCMVNNLPLRNRVHAEQGFATLLAAERDGLHASLDHATVAFEDIVDALQPQRVFGRHPLFQFMLQFQERRPVLSGAGMEFIAEVPHADRSSYWDMELSVTDYGAGLPLQAFLGVRTDLFEAPTVATWCEGLPALLAAAISAPDQPVAELPLLSAAQRSAVLRVADHCAPADEYTLHGAFATQAARTPDAVALTDSTGSISYRELAAEVSRRLDALRAAGVMPGATVALCMTPGTEFTALLLAINGAGATWLVLDPDYPAARLQAMLDTATAAALITDAGSPALSHPHTWSVRTLGQSSAADEGAAAGFVGVTAHGRASAAAMLSVQFTSGSTGQPKGIGLSQQNALSRLRGYWRRPDLCGATRFAQRTSPGFVDAIWEIFGPLLHGGQVLFAPPAARRDMRELARWVAQQAIEHLVIFPSALAVLLNTWEQQGGAPALRHVIVTGEPPAAALTKRFVAVLPDCVLVNTYGLSETWDIAAARLDRISDAAVMPAGRPLPGVRALVRDARGGLLPAGAAGELWVSVPGLADGYLGSRHLSAGRFCVRDGRPEFATGDMASRRDDGQLLLHGRGDRQLKLRGLRIEPGEIESLASAVPGVGESALVVHDAGTERAWLALYLDGSPAAAVIAEVRAALSAQLPAPLVPTAVIGVDSLPRTPSGKLDTRRLENQERDRRLPVGATADTAPSGATESRLATIWQELLGIMVVSRADDFFALRGNSLLATRLTARICDEFGLDLPLAAVFESPTLAGLAAAIDALLWTGREAAEQGDDDAERGAREVVRL